MSLHFGSQRPNTQYDSVCIAGHRCKATTAIHKPSTGVHVKIGGLFDKRTKHFGTTIVFDGHAPSLLYIMHRQIVHMSNLAAVFDIWFVYCLGKSCAYQAWPSFSKNTPIYVVSMEHPCCR